MRSSWWRACALRALALFTVVSVMATVVMACRAPRRQAAARCEVWVTRDFGGSLLKQAGVTFLPGDSVMDVTRRLCRVETAYGGGFVKALDGLASTGGRSSQGGDWFYYVDGILAGRGAIETKVPPGCVIWWDYHAWSHGGGQFPAVVGAWPRPVDSGGEVLFTPSGGPQARRLASAMGDFTGGNPATAGPASGVPPVAGYGGESLAERHAPIILVGLAGEMMRSPWLASLFRSAWQAGLPATVRESGIVGFDTSGRDSATWREGSGLVVATASYMGDHSPLWLVVGWDEAGLERTVTVLVDGLRGEERGLKYAFGVAVTPGGTVRLPFSPAPGRRAP